MSQDMTGSEFSETGNAIVGAINAVLLSLPIWAVVIFAVRRWLV